MCISLESTGNQKESSLRTEFRANRNSGAVKKALLGSGGGLNVLGMSNYHGQHLPHCRVRSSGSSQILVPALQTCSVRRKGE